MGAGLPVLVEWWVWLWVWPILYGGDRLPVLGGRKTTKSLYGMSGGVGVVMGVVTGVQPLILYYRIWVWL